MQSSTPCLGKCPWNSLLCLQCQYSTSLREQVHLKSWFKKKKTIILKIQKKGNVWSSFGSFTCFDLESFLYILLDATLGRKARSSISERGWLMQDALQVLGEGKDDGLYVALEFGQSSCSNRKLFSLCLGLRDIASPNNHLVYFWQ